MEKEKKLQNAMLGLKKRFGKNAVLKGTNYLDGATMRERNQQIGGHKAKEGGRTWTTRTHRKEDTQNEST